MAKPVADADDTPESPAEVADWREAEELLGAIEQAWDRFSVSLGLDGPIPAYIRVQPLTPEAASEAQKAAFELGALAFWDDITLGRQQRQRARSGSSEAARRRRRHTAGQDATLLAAAAEYRKRHPRATGRQMAKDLARQLSKDLKRAIAAGTVRDRLRKLKR